MRQRFFWISTILLFTLAVIIISLVILVNIRNRRENSQVLAQTPQSQKITSILFRKNAAESKLDSTEQAHANNLWSRIKNSQRLYYLNRLIAENPPNKIDLTRLIDSLCINAKQAKKNPAECLSIDDLGTRLFRFYGLRLNYNRNSEQWALLEPLYYELLFVFPHLLIFQKDFLSQLIYWQKKDPQKKYLETWLARFADPQKNHSYLVSVLSQLEPQHEAYLFALKTLYVLNKTTIEKQQLLLLGLIHEKEYDEALKIARDILKKNAQDAVIRAILGKLWLIEEYQPDYAEAYKELKRAIGLYQKLRNKLPPELLIDAGFAAFKNNDLKNAESYLKQALLWQPKDKNSYEILKQVYLLKNDLKAADEITQILEKL